MLPVDEVPARAHESAPTHPTQLPLLLLPFAREVSVKELLPTTAKPELNKLLASINLDKLQLRPARKIAKALGVAQKVNGKDQPLSWLRAQIKAKLQQSQELDPVAIETMRELLAS